jgi:hypothetical protein
MVDVNSLTKLLWSSLQESMEVVSVNSCACYCNVIVTSKVCPPQSIVRQMSLKTM